LDDTIDKLIELTESKEVLEAELGYIKSQIAAHNEAVSEMFLNSGTQSVTRHGMTVSIATTSYCKAKVGVDYATIADSLRREGYSDLLTVNHSMLKSVIKELANDKMRPPKTVRELMDIGSMTKVRCRKAPT